jgi:hypothetical protein
MKPTVGRIVHYLHASSDGRQNGAEFSPAIVLQAWGDAEKPCLNLGVFLAGGAYEWRTSVVHEDDRYVEVGGPAVGNAWRWPPREA